MSAFLNSIQQTHEYAAIAGFYGSRRAERSGVLLINHINEGIEIIARYRQLVEDKGQFNLRFNQIMAARAYCLHPLFQNDLELLNQGMPHAQSKVASAHAVALAMEYRARANAWLSHKVISCEMPKDATEGGPVEMEPAIRCEGMPIAGFVPEVRAMLVADKVQNNKDFLAHHQGKHARSLELSIYFTHWLTHALGLSSSDVMALEEAAAHA